jgi:hypothetical protein
MVMITPDFCGTMCRTIARGRVELCAQRGVDRPREAVEWHVWQGRTVDGAGTTPH